MTNFSAFLSDFAEMSASASPPSGRVRPRRARVPCDIDEFERAAAEVADHAVGLVHAGNDAERRQFRLARAREHVDLGLMIRSASLMKAGPFLASRQAAVAIARTSLHAHRVQSAR